MKAFWKGQILAESDDIVLVEGNHYFPMESIKQEFFKASEHQSACFWKGTASYYSIVVDGDENENAAWYYPEPKESAAEIKNRIAFWKGVDVVP